MKGQPTLICIPDISGFTEFMSRTDFELSSKVIPSLLNNIIYSNEIELKISEIEGDAVLFFRSGEPPSFKTLIAQCTNFYTEFYKQILSLQKEYSDTEQAFKIPKILGLKIIIHYGDEIGITPIGKRMKLMGQGVIIAHRLLKNDIPLDEYILISDALLNRYKTGKDETFIRNALTSGEINESHLGKIGFHYIDFASLI